MRGLVVEIKTPKYGKKATEIRIFRISKDRLRAIEKRCKHDFACGGSSYMEGKEGIIILQGNHKEKAEVLVAQLLEDNSDSTTPNPL